MRPADDEDMLDSAVPPAARHVRDRASALLYELAPQGPTAALPELDRAIAALIDLRAQGQLSAEDYIDLAHELIDTARGLRLIDREERIARSFAAGLPG